MSVDPYDCSHPSTVIYATDDGEKVEECALCDTIVSKFDVSETHYCEHPTADGTCSRTVDGPDEHCWQHE